MKLRVSSVLPVNAGQAWALMNPETLKRITRGLVSFEGQVPEKYEEGDVVHTRLRLFGLFPAYDYEMRCVLLDRAGGVLVSHEKGGLVRSWQHHISIQPLTATTSRHTDEVEIDAGLATPVVWALANVFYRVRHARERQLASQGIIEAT